MPERQTIHQYPEHWYTRFPEPPVGSMAWPLWRGRNEQIDKYGHEPKTERWGRNCVECGRYVYSGPFGKGHSDETAGWEK